jgi:type IV pilus assembly protein PilC
LPLIGDLIKKIMVARLCRNLGIMLTSGVSLLVALNMVRQVLDNVVFREILQDVYSSVERGDGLHKSLVTYNEIPKDVAYMISVGEQSGNLGVMLNKIADFYETKVHFEIKDLVTLIEPAFICILGIVVGIIMAAMILPLFDMVKTIENVRK